MKIRVITDRFYIDSIKYLTVLILCLMQISCSIFGFFREAKPAPNLLNQANFHLDQKNQVSVYWIGHSTMLIRIYDRWVLTDPALEEKVGSLVRRYVKAAVAAEDVPKLSWTLLSHLHFDHFDLASLHKIAAARSGDKNGKLAFPFGMRDYLTRINFQGMMGLKPWQSSEYEGVKITAVPARHFGGRYGFDMLWTNEPYTGFVIEYRGISIYFAGDTGRDDHLYKEIGEKFPGILLALMPVGPARNNRSEVYRQVHLVPEDAVSAFADLKAKYMIPVHHSTFFTHGNPEIKLIQTAMDQSPNKQNIFLMDIGQSFHFDGVGHEIKGNNSLLEYLEK